MAPSKNINRKRPSEHTPLLRNIPPEPEDSAIDDAEIQGAEISGEGALEPGTFPELGKRRSYSHSHWLAPDEDSNARPEPEIPSKFQDNGLLDGISQTKFRLIFGGILLGHFVSIISRSPYNCSLLSVRFATIRNTDWLLDCNV